MRKTLAHLVVLLAVMAAPVASAQFQNRSVGVGVSVMKLAADTEPIDWGVPLTLEATLYIENGFDLYLHVPVMMLYQKIGVTADGKGGFVLATGGQFGVRYLFSEESVRPWVGLELAGLYIFRETAAGPSFMGGPGVMAGLDYFVADSVSIGGRAFFDLFLTLNQPLRFNFGGGIAAAAYF